MPIGAVAISVYFFIVSPCLLKLFSFQDKSSPYTGELVFIILNVSGLTFCKPCFVPSYCKRLITSYSGGNHLSTESILSFSPLNSVKKVPLPKFGFLARGVYRVPLSPFLVRLRHCGTFKDTQPYPKDVGFFPAVSL
ncbi:hypothetical protein BSBH6_01720 [Bacillus subtilis]|nr:hypothetical protein BSBH6_01720 [Bacillus subtilis]RPK25557.1 hypothetical protein BH5_02389 [Bacillus subtilis]